MRGDALINKCIIVWTSKTKSFLPSLGKREGFPLFGKEGLGEIFTTICLFNYGFLRKSSLYPYLSPWSRTEPDAFWPH